jgi:preprotein translocase subunit SecD
MKKLLLAVLAGIGLSMFMAATASAGTVLQMRLADNKASDGAEQMSYVTQHDGDTSTTVLYVQKEVLLDDSMLKSAKAGTDSLGHPNINITLNDAGKKRFAEVTRENLHKKLAILIDGKIYTAPMIQQEITGGTAQISGSFSKEEAKDLAKKLNEAAKHK